VNTITWCFDCQSKSDDRDYYDRISDRYFDFYKQIYIPYAVIDGTLERDDAYGEGANCDIQDTYDYYKDGYDQRKGVPASLNLTLLSTFDPSSGKGLITVTASLEQNLSSSQTANKLWIVLYQKNVPYNYSPSQKGIIAHLARDIVLYEDFAPTQAGQTQTFTAEYLISSKWRAEDMGVLVFAQSEKTKEVFQSAFLGTIFTQAPPRTGHGRPISVP
jgi:hypothetical protein